MAPTDNPGNPDLWTALTGVLDLVGTFGTLLWCQGHNDARTPAAGVNGGITQAGVYIAALQTLITALAARYPGLAFGRVISGIPTVTAAAGGKYPAAALETIRGAQQAYVATDPLAVEVDGLDTVVTTGEGVHPTQAGNIALARHCYRATIGLLNPSAYPAGDQGPKLTGTATRAAGSATITLPVLQNKGSSLACLGGAPATQFTVFPSGQTSGALPIASVALAANEITLALATVPADSQALDIWYRLPYDSATAPANCITDTVTDADGLTTGRTLMLTGATAALTASAPATNARITLIAPSGPFIAGTGTITLSGTVTSDTGAITVSVDNGPASSLVNSQSGSYSGIIAVPATGGSHTIVVALADQPTIVASRTITVEQAILSAVPTSGTQSVLVWGAACTLAGLSTGYAVLRTGGADEGTRRAFIGTTVPAIAPALTGAYTLAIYDAETGGTLLANSATITITPNPALPTLSTPVVQFDASSAESVYADAARTINQFGNLASVQAIADLTGNARHLQQTIASQAAQLVINRRNGRPGLKLIGANTAQLANLPGATWLSGLMSGPLTILAVFEISSVVSNIAPYVPFSFAYSGNATGSNSFDVQASTTGTAFVGGARNPASGFGAAKDTAAGVTQTGVLLKVAASFDGLNTMISQVNTDIPVTNTSITGTLVPSGQLWDTMLLGGQPGSPAFGFDGYIYEVDVWADAATAPQLTSLVTYATTKWGN